jgi:hypothetical protein
MDIVKYTLNLLSSKAFKKNNCKTPAPHVAILSAIFCPIVNPFFVSTSNLLANTLAL